MMRAKQLLLLLGPLALAACTVVPVAGPMALLPGPGKTQDAFREDDLACTQAAQSLGAGQTAQAMDAAYTQCMQAHGNVLQAVPAQYASPAGGYGYTPAYADGNPYGYYDSGYAYGYPYGGDPYWSGLYGSAWLGYPIIVGGWGGNWGGGWHRWHGGGHWGGGGQWNGGQWGGGQWGGRPPGGGPGPGPGPGSGPGGAGFGGAGHWGGGGPGFGGAGVGRAPGGQGGGGPSGGGPGGGGGGSWGGGGSGDSGSRGGGRGQWGGGR